MNSTQQRSEIQVSQQPTSPSMGPTATAAEPVFRFYLNPPQAQPTPMYQPLPGMYAGGYGGYIPMSPSPASFQHHHQYYGQAMPQPMAPVSMQHAQSGMYYPGQLARGPVVPGMGVPQMTASPQPPPMQQQQQQQQQQQGMYGKPMMAAGSAAAAAVELADTTMVAGELDVVGRAAVGSAEAPVGGYGVDENGQYIEIKFPSMGHAAGHATAAAMHAGGNAVSSQTVGSQPGGNGNVVARQGPIVKSQATESLPTPVPHQQHQSESESEVDAPGPVSVLDTAAYVDRHMEDIVLDRQAYFWNIANWDALDKRATSDVFQCGGHSWRILLRPFGSSHKGVLSFFLESMDTQHGNPDVKITCKFVLAVANPNDPTHSTSGSAYHCFNQNNPNWGFTRFMKLAELRTGLTPGAKPFIENGACTICAYVHVLRDPSH